MVVVVGVKMTVVVILVMLMEEMRFQREDGWEGDAVKMLNYIHLPLDSP